MFAKAVTAYFAKNICREHGLGTPSAMVLVILMPYSTGSAPRAAHERDVHKKAR